MFTGRKRDSEMSVVVLVSVALCWSFKLQGHLSLIDGVIGTLNLSGVWRLNGPRLDAPARPSNYS